MEKFIIFYCSFFGYDNVCVDAESLSRAISIADVFSSKFGVTIVGVCPEFLLNNWYHE